MNHSVKSMRTFLHGSLKDFAEAADLGRLATPETLTSLVVALGHYEEEGAKLAPEFYICARIEKLLRLVPNSQLLVLGYHADAAASISAALKKIAPLATEGWCIFVDIEEKECRYGVFRGPINPLAINIEQTLLGSPDENCPVIRVAQVAPGCIELRNSLGYSHTIFLSDRSDDSASPSNHVEQLAHAACRSVSESIRAPLHSYFVNTLGRGLRESHGSLVVVTQSQRVPAFLSDGVLLSPPHKICRVSTVCSSVSTGRKC